MAGVLLYMFLAYVVCTGVYVLVCHSAMYL